MSQSKKKGGDVKKAPPGFYLPGEARRRLDVTPAVFRSMIGRGELERIVPPGRSEGLFRASDIDEKADQNALFYLQNMPAAKYAPLEFGCATEGDMRGIFNAVASVWGAEGITPIEIHRALYKANPYISYVIRFRGLVLGYINATPYKSDVLEAIMEGRKRGVDLTTHDVLPYEPGKSYDVYVGIVVRQDVPRHEHYAQRLISGFFGALCDLARGGIVIRRMYAISDQERSIKISRDLGFKEQESYPGRFVLDLETTESGLARRYREVVQNKQPPYKFIQRKKVIHDPSIEETLQYILSVLRGDHAIDCQHTITLFLVLADQLVQSSQMTPEQQTLLKQVHEVLADIGEGETHA